VGYQRGQCLQNRGYSDGVWAVALLADGHILASSSDEQIVRLWDTRGSQYLEPAKTYRLDLVSRLQSMAKPGSASDDQTIKLWDVSTGQCHRYIVAGTGVTWQPSKGTTLASGSTGTKNHGCGMPAAGECLKTLQDPDSRLWSAAFSPN